MQVGGDGIYNDERSCRGKDGEGADEGAAALKAYRLEVRGWESKQVRVRDSQSAGV